MSSTTEIFRNASEAKKRMPMRDDYSLMRRKSNYTPEIRRNKMLGFFFIASTWWLSLTTRRKLLMPLLFSSSNHVLAIMQLRVITCFFISFVARGHDLLKIIIEFSEIWGIFLKNYRWILFVWLTQMFRAILIQFNKV